MVPHILGYFPMTAAWVVIIVRRCLLTHHLTHTH